MNLINATETLERAVRASWTAKGWVQDGAVTASADRFQTLPGRFSSKLFADGSVVRCVFKDGELQRIPPVSVFASRTAIPVEPCRITGAVPVQLSPSAGEDMHRRRVRPKTVKRVACAQKAVALQFWVRLQLWHVLGRQQSSSHRSQCGFACCAD